MAEQDFTDEWSARALNTIDTVVATVNDRAIRPAVVAARAVVFGVIIGVIAVAVVVLLCVGFIRLADSYLTDHHVWIAYLALGALLVGAGAFAYSKRGATSASDA